MSEVDRIARTRLRAGHARQQEAEERAAADRAEQRERLEIEIRRLIPKVLARLQQQADYGDMESITYSVERIPLLGGILGWRKTTRAAWKIGIWVSPRGRELRGPGNRPSYLPSYESAVLLVSNGQIGVDGPGAVVVHTVEDVGRLWPDLLPIILAGLRERE
jgi:hypothetical protein